MYVERELIEVSTLDFKDALAVILPKKKRPKRIVTIILFLASDKKFAISDSESRSTIAELDAKGRWSKEAEIDGYLLKEFLKKLSGDKIQFDKTVSQVSVKCGPSSLTLNRFDEDYPPYS